MLAVPLLRDGRAIGTISVWLPDVPSPFPDSQIALLQTFADQAVIAIENVRLFNELEARNRDLTEALEQQTATSEILRVISQSQTDVQPVFDTIAAAALKLCGAAQRLVFDLRRRADPPRSASPTSSRRRRRCIRQHFPTPPSRETRRCASHADLRSVVDDSGRPGRTPNTRSGRRPARGRISQRPRGAAVRDGTPIGAITVGRPEPGTFPESQIALLQTFADQAVIAIENVRLFTELETRNRDLTEALEQQTATSDILRVISQSQTDVQPVFDTIVAADDEALPRERGQRLHVRRRADPSGGARERESGVRRGDSAQSFRGRPGATRRSAARSRRGASCMIADVLADAEYAIGAQRRRRLPQRPGRSPDARRTRRSAASSSARPEPGRFRTRRSRCCRPSPTRR